MLMLGIWALIWDNIAVWGPYCWGDHTNLMASSATCGYDKVRALAAKWNYVCIRDRSTVGVSVNIHGSWCHQSPYRCSGSGPHPVALFVSKGRVAIRTRQIWVACSGSQGHDIIRIQAVAKGISGSMTQQQPRSGLISMAPVLFHGK